jgi:sulfite exporter TauE/SafE
LFVNLSTKKLGPKKTKNLFIHSLGPKKEKKRKEKNPFLFVCKFIHNLGNLANYFQLGKERKGIGEERDDAASSSSSNCCTYLLEELWELVVALGIVAAAAAATHQLETNTIPKNSYNRILLLLLRSRIFRERQTETETERVWLLFVSAKGITT